MMHPSTVSSQPLPAAPASSGAVQASADDLQSVVRQLKQMHTAMAVLQADRHQEAYDARAAVAQLTAQLEAERRNRPNVALLSSIDQHLQDIARASSEVSTIAQAIRDEDSRINRQLSAALPPAAHQPHHPAHTTGAPAFQPYQQQRRQ